MNYCDGAFGKIPGFPDCFKVVLRRVSSYKILVQFIWQFLIQFS